MRKLFKGGTVVSGKGTKRADVLVDGEKIVRVARSITDPLAQTVDVTGKFLLPGFIDAHTHFDLDVANTTTVDDFDSGSLAAIHGGTTTVIDFACPNKGETLAHGLQLWHEKADGKCACDYGFHMTIDDWNETIEREIDDMYAEAAVEPNAMSESMFGAPWTSVLKPTRKNLKLTNTTGKSSRNCVSANVSTFSSPRKNPGSGQPNMCPIDR